MVQMPDESREELEGKLEEDGETPFRPAGDVGVPIDDTHPTTDTDIEEEDQYENGLGEATNPNH